MAVINRFTNNSYLKGVPNIEQKIVNLFSPLPYAVKARVISLLSQILASEVNEDEQPLISKESNSFLGVYQGQVWMSDDFDAPLSDFQQYTE